MPGRAQVQDRETSETQYVNAGGGRWIVPRVLTEVIRATVPDRFESPAANESRP